MNNLMDNKAVMLGLAVLAFLVAAVLVIMIFRMLFGGRLRMPGGRARQARLGIVDAFDLDRQRQLIIIRRDNTEHLIMIGGPNDLVVESEIVRAEARELRDARRDPTLAAGAPDGRIPAPPPALEKPETVPPRPVDEPMLPMPLPAAANEPRRDPAPETRAPTFPLPPRRPAPVERRPAPPPQLPDSVSRGEEIPALSGQPPAPAPAPPAPTLSPSPAPVPVAASAPTVPPPADAPKRPPFLKPLTPRPPIRPLQRTTPQPPALPPRPDAPAEGPKPASPPVSSASPSAAPQPSAPPRPAQVAPVASPPKPPRPPAPVAPPPPPLQEAESKDALESLEEEMAKLLGRGS